MCRGLNVVFIPSQNYIVYNYKSINLTKPGNYVRGCINYCIPIKFDSFIVKNDPKTVKKKGPRSLTGSL